MPTPKVENVRWNDVNRVYCLLSVDGIHGVIYIYRRSHSVRCGNSPRRLTHPLSFESSPKLVQSDVVPRHTGPNKDTIQSKRKGTCESRWQGKYTLSLSWPRQSPKPNGKNGEECQSDETEVQIRLLGKIFVRYAVRQVMLGPIFCDVYAERSMLGIVVVVSGSQWTYCQVFCDKVEWC